MKNEKVKRKAMVAIRTIIRAAKELAEAEATYYKSKVKKGKKERKQND
jgi:hypothetical protein